jgi:hypothetical protein
VGGGTGWRWKMRIGTIGHSIVGRFCQKKKVKTVLLSFHQKKSRKESCCYNAKEIAKNNSSVGLRRKKNSSVAEKQIGGKANQTIHA